MMDFRLLNDFVPTLFVAIGMALAVAMLFMARRRRQRRHARVMAFRFGDFQDDTANPADTSDEPEDALFKPTQVVSYADAVRAGQIDPALDQAAARARQTVATNDRRQVTAVLRVRIVAPDGGQRFTTLQVSRIVAAGGSRMVLGREGRDAPMMAVDVQRITAAVDLETKEQIRDLWTWLTGRAARVLEDRTTGPATQPA